MSFILELDEPTKLELGPVKIREINTKNSDPDHFAMFLKEVDEYNKIPAQDMFRGTATVDDVANEIQSRTPKGTSIRGGRKTRKRRFKRTQNRKQYKRKTRR